MDRLFLLLSVLFVTTFTLVSCASLHSPAVKHATCNKLKSDVVFSGSTSDVRKAEIQHAEAPLQQENYDKENCSP